MDSLRSFQVSFSPIVCMCIRVLICCLIDVLFHVAPPIHQIATKKKFQGLKLINLQEALLLFSISRVRVSRLACSVVCIFEAQFVSGGFSNLFENSSVTIGIEQDHRDMVIRLFVIHIHTATFCCEFGDVGDCGTSGCWMVIVSSGFCPSSEIRSPRPLSVRRCIRRSW